MPTFKITVEDPQKIGDPISAHIIYRVRTRVRILLELSRVNLS